MSVKRRHELYAKPCTKQTKEVEAFRAEKDCKALQEPKLKTKLFLFL